MANFKVIIRISPTYETLGSLFSRRANDSGVVGKVLCTLAWITCRVLSTYVGMKRFVCDSTGLEMNGVSLAI
jgi:hypothetical protein